MGRRRTTPVVTVGQLWNALLADYGGAGTHSQALEDAIDALEDGTFGLSALNDDLDALLVDRPATLLNFYDEFNRTVEDTDVWTSGGDDGAYVMGGLVGDPTSWYIRCGNVIDNDRYLNSAGVVNGKIFSPAEYGYTTVTFEARIKLLSVANVSALLGLSQLAITNYAEPVNDSAIFFIDPAITNTFRARSYEVAEEETDTLVALDTDWHRFKIVWTAASVLFYIDDVLVATHAVEVPDWRMYLCLLIRTEEAAVKDMYIDYVRVEVS